MNRRQCTLTGLSIIEGPVAMYRVSVCRSGRGPLNPKERPADPAVDRRDWNRFDTPGLTIYGADQRVTAFTESLAYDNGESRDVPAFAYGWTQVHEKSSTSRKTSGTSANGAKPSFCIAG